MPKGNWGHKYYKGTGFKDGHTIDKGRHFKNGEHNGKEFKKSNTPWNKGKKGLQVSNRKGKKFPNQSGEKHPNWKGGVSWRYKIKKLEEIRPKPSNCEICGDIGIICYDHCHKTGKFRGWVCSSCNCIMGFANDKIEKLEKVIQYLKINGTK